MMQVAQRLDPELAKNAVQFESDCDGCGATESSAACGGCSETEGSAAVAENEPVKAKFDAVTARVGQRRRVREINSH